MSKAKRFRFGNDYLDRYVERIFQYKVVTVDGERYAKMQIRPRRHRDGQQWAYRGKTQD